VLTLMRLQLLLPYLDQVLSWSKVMSLLLSYFSSCCRHYCHRLSR